jgi:hypothetical protein
MKNIFVVVTVSVLFTPVASAIDYISLEKLAAAVACKKNATTCVPFIEKSRETKTSAYKVDGRVMPPDAMKNDDQQRQMLSANLYVKADGSVAQLYTVDESNIEQAAIREKNTVLPFKNFEIPPAISGSMEKMTITTGEVK